MSSQRFVTQKHWQIIFLATRAQKSQMKKQFLPFLSLLGRGQTGSSASFISSALWCRSHSFGYKLHLPVPALAGQPGCNGWQRHKSLLYCHHSKVIRFALPGVPVCLFIFSLSVVGDKTKQTSQHLLDTGAGVCQGYPCEAWGLGLEEQKKSGHEEIRRHPYLYMQKSLCSVNKKHCEKQSLDFLIQGKKK